MITIQELLSLRNLPATQKIKLVRHAPHTYAEYKSNYPLFLKYQEEQHLKIFHKCEYIISFIGEGETTARFIGVYKINGERAFKNGYYYYDIEEVSGFEDFKDRVVIEWGSSTRMWHQWITQKKEVLEIQTGKYSNKQFKDYLDFVLDYTELKEIISNIHIYKEWRTMLSAVKGIYLILDKVTGKKYIGSAYGDGGIWERWCEYVKTNGHCNNKQLLELISKNPNKVEDFQFTILRTMSKTVTAKEVIEREQLYKKKMGTMAFGLNSN